MTDRQLDLVSAVGAVRTAARAVRAVQARMVRPETLEKKDKSPVTVADFASQAIVCARLAESLPDDPVVGEEDAAALRDAAQAPLRTAIVERVSAELGGSPNEETVLGWIDRGLGAADTPRYWTLDPIDGTKGFLRGDQYAIALGLIEEGEVVLGILGCPNLPLDGERGALFTAVRGQRTQALPLWDAEAEGREVRVGDIGSAAEARFCESVESAHSDQDESARVAELLGIRTEPYRIDSQCKYAAVARDDAQSGRS